MYAVEMLGYAPWVTHAINILLIGVSHKCISYIHTELTCRNADDVLWVWWYDRQGAIQSQGISFLVNLPHFLVLLLAFQRFSPEDWGLSPSMNADIHSVHTRHCTNESGEALYTMPQSFKCQLEDLIEVDMTIPFAYRYGMVGRATSVFKCTSETKSGSVPLVAKISWPEATRDSEADIIREAHRVGHGVNEITEHLPSLNHLQERTFHEHNTMTIRTILHVEWKGRQTGGRVLRLLVQEELAPITLLMGEKFMDAWFEIVRCEWLDCCASMVRMTNNDC